MYDGTEEFWVIIREEGKRQDSLSWEEIHEKKSKAGNSVLELMFTKSNGHVSLQLSHMHGFPSMHYSF